MLRSFSSPRNSRLALFTLLMAGLFVGRVQADPLTATYEGWGSGDPIVNISLNGTPYSGIAGQSYLKLSDGQEVTAFCIDIIHGVNPGQTYLVDERSTNDGLTNGGKIAYLANLGAATLDPAHAAALQIAIWDEVYNNGSTSGPFQYISGGDASIPSLVNYYLGQAQTNSGTSTWLDASSSWTTSSPGQSMVVADPPPPPVPEPSTFLLLAASLVGLGLCYRMSQRLLFRKPSLAS